MTRLMPGIFPWLMSTFPFHSSSFVSNPLSHFSLVLGVANAGPRLGLQTKIGHPAHRHERVMPDPVLGDRRI